MPFRDRFVAWLLRKLLFNIATKHYRAYLIASLQVGSMLLKESAQQEGQKLIDTAQSYHRS